ncbi:MAG: polyprenol monophosphomannose synthase [Deltaproteobacteria bacterium]|nr:polyprenol monophosphomannose synthase [Deltaproteobacteria bacterium]
MECAVPKILIITPTYNERDNLAPFLDGVFDILPDAHVLVVDDASPDGTGALADRIAERDARVKVHHRPGKLGLGSAYLEAFRIGIDEGYDLIFEMDTDLSHDPRYLPDFLKAFEDGADLVIGSRNVPGGGVDGWGPGRHVISKGGSLYSRFMLGLSVKDLTSGYKGFRREVLESIVLGDVRSEGYSFQVELTYRSVLRGFEVAEVPIVFVDRRAGQSKMSRRIFAEAVLMMPRLRLMAMAGKL